MIVDITIDSPAAIIDARLVLSKRLVASVDRGDSCSKLANQGLELGLSATVITNGADDLGANGPEWLRNK